MNEIYIGSLTTPLFHFTDDDITSGNVYIVNSPISDTLEEDAFNFTVISDATGNRRIYTKFLEWYKTKFDEGYVVAYKDILQYKYGTPVWYFHNDELVGKFYLVKVVQQNAKKFALSCVSAVGLLSNIRHYGGMYEEDSTKTYADLIREIVGNIPIEIDPAFEGGIVQGYLKVQSCREALQQILFATGGAILKNDDGNLIVKYNQPDTAHEINIDKIYRNGTLNRLAKATKVSLTEHRYFKSSDTEAKDVYDNLEDLVGVVNQEILFSEPVYDLKAYDENGNDITADFIITSDVNYAVVGTENHQKARITGKPYTHQQRQIIRQTGAQTQEAKEINISNATLVSPLNSTNCMERLISYYGYANEVNMGFVYTDEKTGQLIQYNNLYNPIRQEVGYIKSMDINLSAKLKAASRLAVDWKPNHLGNTYNRYMILDKTALGGLTGNWQVPAELQGKEVYAVLFSGADGGQGGLKGANGQNASGERMDIYYIVETEDFSIYNAVYSPVNEGKGGLGGAGGQGGLGCKRYNTIILTLDENSYQIELGEGGQGGAGNGGEGSEGTHTTFGTYTSDERDLSGVYVNFIDPSQVYCQDGDNGTSGGDGGDGGKASRSNELANPYAYNGENGEGRGIYAGGSASQGILDKESADFYMNVGGGGGGGATKDANGTSAGNGGEVKYLFYDGGRWFRYWVTRQGGDGGNGANATSIPQQNILGRGGFGGNGGGGGGGGGASASYTLSPYHEGDGEEARWSIGGTGGNGSAGGKGSDGFILIYYTEEE